MEMRSSPSPVTIVGMLALFVAVVVSTSERPTPLPSGPTARGGSEMAAGAALPEPGSPAAATASNLAAGAAPSAAPAGPGSGLTATSSARAVTASSPALVGDATAMVATAAVPARVPVRPASEPATARALAKMDLGLRRVVAQGSTEPVRVILQPVVPQAIGAASLQNLQAAGVQVLGVGARDGAIVARVAPAQLVWLASDAATAHISTDAEVAPQQTSRQQNQYTDGIVLRDSLGMKRGGGLLSGGKGYNGNKVVVAVIDSGIAPSKDLSAKRIVAFYDVTSTGTPTAVQPYDDHGHGTHVAGLIGGSGNRSHDRFQGAGSKAKFVGYKVLDKDGAGYTSHVIAALDHATQNRAALGINLINLSLGHPIIESAATDPLVRAVERAVAAGIIVVVSAGNRGMNPATGLPGYGGITSPGNARSAITVGAIDIQNTVARGDDSSRSTARAGRRGSTPSPSRTSPRPGIAWWPPPPDGARSTPSVPARLGARDDDEEERKKLHAPERHEHVGGVTTGLSGGWHRGVPG